MALKYVKTLTLELGATQVECQLTTAQITSDSSEGAETLTTFCGSEDVPGIGKWTLHVAGFQDWGEAAAVTDLIHAAYMAGQSGDDDTMAFTLEVGGTTRSGDCRPTEDAPFGGDAGAAFTFEGDLAVVGTPTEGTLP